MFTAITHDFTQGPLSVPLFIFGDRADQHCSPPSTGGGGWIASPEIQEDEGLSHPQPNLCVPQRQSRAKYPQGHFMCQFTSCSVHCLPLHSYSRPERKAGAVLTLNLFFLCGRMNQKSSSAMFPGFIYPVVGAELLQDASPT